ncbi:NUDIX hydrolase [Martelella soudanensis]|uniref:NUDIX hydrolase n=1 Tax=unclassified Martelella TaxID=2629616 RepID=UPI001FF01216|nr:MULTISPECIES: NUDIX hydrolase [unclassified Martelella]
MADEIVEARQQYAALCYRHAKIKKKKSIEVLLITSRDTGRWVTPKGWPMANKAPHEVAEREAYEEAGIKGKVSDKPFGIFRYLKRLDDGTAVTCVVEIFPLLVRKAKARFPERDERVRKWASPEEAAELVDENELKSLLMDFAGRLGA